MNPETPEKHEDPFITSIDRLFTAFRIEKTKEAGKEWLRVAKKFDIRYVIPAVESLIETSNRFPTIAEFRNAAMAIWSQYDAAAKEVREKSDLYKQLEAQWRKEEFDWWHDRFGIYAKNVRALVSTTCAQAKRPWRASSSFAVLINELTGVDPSTAYERMKEHAQTIQQGRRLPEPPPGDFIGF